MENRFQREALSRFNSEYRAKRETLFKTNEFPKLREELTAMKQDAVNNIDKLYMQFKEKAAAAGSYVYYAEDASKALSTIGNIAITSGSGEIIKSKSMTSEEIFLNYHLEKMGIRTTESDLGEWIVQNRSERPSHMVMPAIHLSRQDVSRLFREVTGSDYDPDDIQAMVKSARKLLREPFFKADIGITGANAAIAETGTLCTVTNEGNLELTASLPHIHIAIVGIEKLVPDFNAFQKILKVLPRNATGQLLTSYVSMINGPVPSLKDNSRRELHIIFLDNGRSAIAKDPVFRQALSCIRCGACANVCPVYSVVGGHRFGYVYVGAIGLVLSMFYHGPESVQSVISNCINCQACAEVCPASINLPDLIKTAQSRIHKDTGIPLKNRILGILMNNRKIFHLALRTGAIVQRPFLRKGASRNIPRHLPDLFTKGLGFRHFPALAGKPFRAIMKKHSPIAEPGQIKITFFAGCAIDFIYPEMAEAFMKLIADNNIAVNFPSQQTCCGLPLYSASKFDSAFAVASQNSGAFSSEGYGEGPIVTMCASCASFIRNHYASLASLTDNSSVKEKMISVSQRIIDFTAFISGHGVLDSDSFDGRGIKFSHHCPCHLSRGMGIKDEPVQLLKNAGYDYSEMRDRDVCCGFGGTYAIDFPDISKAILDRKVSAIKESGAQIITTDCPGCIMQIRRGIEETGLPLRVMHTAEALLNAIKS